MHRYGGKSNWLEDKNAKRTALYAAMPKEMKVPWRSDMAEVRVIDHAARSIDEFKAYLAVHDAAAAGGAGGGDEAAAAAAAAAAPKDYRFLKAEVDKSAAVRLSMATEAAIASYVCNYIHTDTHYSEESRNCQTFAADFFGFLSGQPCGSGKVEPYAPLNRLMYTPATSSFLYTPL